MKRTLRCLSLAAMFWLAGALAGCDDLTDSAGESVGESASSARPESAAAVDQPQGESQGESKGEPKGGLFATVGGRVITRNQFDAFLKLKGMEKASASVLDRAGSEFLEREALAQAITEKNFLDPALTEAELNEFRKQMLISRYMDAYLKEQVSDEAIRNYYNLHPEQYQSEQVRVSHILLRTTNKIDSSELQALLTAAHEIYSKLRANADFTELAAQHSEDKISAVKGGDLGWLKRGAVHPEFSTRIFAMGTGEVSEPFRTPFGIHIVRLEEGPVTTKTPFEVVKGDIRYQLRNEAKRAELERLFAGVEITRAKAKGKTKTTTPAGEAQQ